MIPSMINVTHNNNIVVDFHYSYYYLPISESYFTAAVAVAADPLFELRPEFNPTVPIGLIFNAV
jgi:hypothetical protein